MALLFVDSLPKSNNRVVQISIKALELLLLSAGLISTLVMVRGYVNMPYYSCELVFSSLVGFWSSVKCFLSSPLYICIVINFIVLLIAASSSFHRHEHDDDDGVDVVSRGIHDIKLDESPLLSPPPQPIMPSLEAATPPRTPRVSSRARKCTKCTAAPAMNQDGEKAFLSLAQAREIKKTTHPTSSLQVSSEPIKDNEIFPIQLPNNNENTEEDTIEATWRAITGGGNQRPTQKLLQKGEIMALLPLSPPMEEVAPPQTPRVPSRTRECTMSTTTSSFYQDSENVLHSLSQAHEIDKTMYPLDLTQELLESITGAEIFTNEISYDSETEEDDTIEATWKAISGGGNQTPTQKHLKKSETMAVRSLNASKEASQLPEATSKWKELRKAETFNDAVSITRRGGLRRDPSMSLVEFNKKVEAFIKKFNNDMRLQRQESDQRFLDMIGRGLQSR